MISNFFSESWNLHLENRHSFLIHQHQPILPIYQVQNSFFSQVQNYWSTFLIQLWSRIWLKYGLYLKRWHINSAFEIGIWEGRVLVCHLEFYCLLCLSFKAKFTVIFLVLLFTPCPNLSYLCWHIHKCQLKMCVERQRESHGNKWKATHHQNKNYLSVQTWEFISPSHKTHWYLLNPCWSLLSFTTLRHQSKIHCHEAG